MFTIARRRRAVHYIILVGLIVWLIMTHFKYFQNLKKSVRDDKHSKLLEKRTFLGREKVEIAPTEKKNAFLKSNIYIAKNTSKRVKPKKTLNEFEDSDEDLCVIPEQEDLFPLPLRRLGYLYHMYLACQQVLCRQSDRIGKIGDGGWDICIDEAFKPRDPCLVYSFGINNEFSFDDGITNIFGCNVHSFDPSMEKKSHRRSSEVWFHSIGLRGDVTHTRTTKLWSMSTFHEILKRLNHTTEKLDIVKIDIEGSEWECLEDMVRNTDMTKIYQIVIELHNQPEESREAYIKRLDILRDLHGIGFRIFLVHRNHYCQYYSKALSQMVTGCHELGLLNARYIN